MHRTSDRYFASTDTKLTIGGKSDTFTTTTLKEVKKEEEKDDDKKPEQRKPETVWTNPNKKPGNNAAFRDDDGVATETRPIELDTEAQRNADKKLWDKVGEKYVEQKAQPKYELAAQIVKAFINAMKKRSVGLSEKYQNQIP